MADWEPNSLAAWWRVTARARGETAERVIPKGTDEDWLDAPRASRYARCPKVLFGPHRVRDGEDFCASCGALVADR